VKRRVAAGSRLLEPGVLIGGVVDDQINDDANAAALRLVHELHEVAR
jgi:hypothetical protein